MTVMPPRVNEPEQREHRETHPKMPIARRQENADEGRRVLFRPEPDHRGPRSFRSPSAQLRDHGRPLSGSALAARTPDSGHWSRSRHPIGACQRLSCPKAGDSRLRPQPHHHPKGGDPLDSRRRHRCGHAPPQPESPCSVPVPACGVPTHPAPENPFPEPEGLLGSRETPPNTSSSYTRAAPPPPSGRPPALFDKFTLDGPHRGIRCLARHVRLRQKPRLEVLHRDEVMRVDHGLGQIRPSCRFCRAAFFCTFAAVRRACR